MIKFRLRGRRRQAGREESRPRVHPWPFPGRHTGTGTEDREALRGSPETRQRKFPLAKKPVKPLTRKGRRRRRGNGAAAAAVANSNSRLLLSDFLPHQEASQRKCCVVGGAPRGADQSISLGAPSTRHRERTQRDKRALFV